MPQFKKENFKLFINYARYLLPYRGKELAMIILGEFGVILSLVNPYLSKLLIDQGILNKDLNLFVLIGLAMGMVFVLNGAVNALIQYFNQYISNHVNIDLKGYVFEHLHKLSFAFFQSQSSGEHIYKINYDTDKISGFITATLPEILIIFPRALLIFAIIFYLDKRMAILALSLAPFLYILPYYFTKKNTAILNEIFKSSQKIFSRLIEVFAHMHLVMAFGKGQGEFRDYLRQLLANLKLSLKTAKLGALVSLGSDVVSRLLAGAIFFYGGYQVIKGRVTYGSVTAIMIYISQLFSLQERFIVLCQEAVWGRLSGQRLEEIFRQAPQIKDGPLAKEMKFKQGEIIFRSVKFAYPGKKPVLENLNFKIASGAHIALVGPSGCGKTTMVNLILRLFQPQSGEILIDGYELSEIKLGSLYAQIGVALQEPFLWDDTIESNIKYGREDASYAEIISAAQLADANSFIEELPGKYSAKLGENATLISEGQKQRIAIARAVIKKPAILILDEALSSLDIFSEKIILENILAERKNQTTIIISHRLSVLNFVQWVYLLKGPDRMVIQNPKEFLSSQDSRDLQTKLVEDYTKTQV